MQCPYCQTENRDDRDRCYHCDKDLSMLRLIVNKAKHHYNRGLELAERGHDEDAIQELRNAIELDQSLINAHVVLGSLYARHEQFDQANDSWKNAIEQDNRYSKAHEYLSKVETVKLTFPTIKRLQVIAGVCGLLFIISFGVMIYALIPEPKPPTVDEVLADVPSADFRKMEIRRMLAKIALDENMPPKIQEMADSINRMVENNVRSWIEMTGQALDGNAPDVAMLMLERLARTEIEDEETRNVLNQLQARAISQLSGNVYSASLSYQAGQMGYEEFEKIAKKFLDRFAETEEGAEVQVLKDSIQKQEREKILVVAQTKIMTDPWSSALQMANSLIAQYPEITESVNNLVDLRLKTEEEIQLSLIDGMILDNEFAEARSRIGELKLMFESAGRTPPTKQLADFATRIEELQAGRTLDAAYTAYETGEFNEFLEITKSIENITTDKLEQAKLREMRKEVLVKLAVKESKWFRDLDWRFPEMAIVPEQASHAIEVYRSVIENLPDNEQYMHTAILFYTACAYLRLDQADEAKKLITEIESLKDVSYPRYVRDYVASLKTNYPAIVPEATDSGQTDGDSSDEDPMDSDVDVVTSGPVELKIMEKITPQQGIDPS